VVAAVALATFTAAGGTATSARCSQAEATRAGAPYAFDPSDPKVGLELCGAFLGPGSEAMVVSFFFPTCWPLQSWAVFRATSGGWKLVKLIPAYLAPSRHLVAVGGDIRETTAVHRPGDARCFPTGGTRSRVWHWNGTALVPGPWKQVTPPTTPPAAPPTPPPAQGTFKYGYLRAPSGNIQCEWGYGGSSKPWVRCGIRSGLKPPPPSRGPGCVQRPWYVMSPTGPASLGPSICPGEDEGDSGPFADSRTAKLLPYGKTWSAAGMSCASAVAGLTCRNRSRHGWFLSRARSRRF
jgi:Family of unknown function (DUF6636)